jgi:hypothetical protein
MMARRPVGTETGVPLAWDPPPWVGRHLTGTVYAFCDGGR